MKRTFLTFLAVAGLFAAGCDKEPVPEDTDNGGNGNEDLPAAVYGALTVDGVSGSTAELTLKNDGEEKTLSIVLSLEEPASEAYEAGLQIDETLLGEFNSEHSAEAVMLPEANRSFADGSMTFRVAEGETRASIALTVRSEGLSVESRYLLPLKALPAAGGDDLGEPVYVLLTVREPSLLNDYEMYPDIFTVYYVNTNDYHPGLVTDYSYTVVKNSDNSTEYYNTGNIVNLREANIDYDAAAQRPVLKLQEKLSMVLDDPAKYLYKLQDAGRKVCICIEGGGKGIGFCNLNDAQIADLVAQIRTVVDRAGLDGVNLWDRNSNYGAEGMPEAGTESYPKFIRALREALGTGRLVTLTDFEEPTSYFWDTEKTGGIEVGKYLDYAWSGYYKDEVPQIVDPYNQGKPGVSELYPRKPIAGLPAEKYGCVALDTYSYQSINNWEMDDSGWHIKQFYDWVFSGCSKNTIVVKGDLMTRIQGIYEGAIENDVFVIYTVMGIENPFGPDGINIVVGDNLSFYPNGQGGYNKWMWTKGEELGLEWW